MRRVTTAAAISIAINLDLEVGNGFLSKGFLPLIITWRPSYIPQACTATATAAAAAAAHLSQSASGEAGKPQISHSTVEKQRRDRLNSLIEELGDLVPPQDPKYSNEGTTVRRPKHVVLSDTIFMVKNLQDKLRIEEAEIEGLKRRTEAAVTSPATTSLELPALPDNSSRAAEIVDVEQGSSSMFVKVWGRQGGSAFGSAASQQLFNIVAH